MAVATQRDPLELPPLYATVDPEALDALLAPAFDQEASREMRVSFEYAGCQVTIEGRETVQVNPRTETTADGD